MPRRPRPSLDDNRSKGAAAGVVILIIIVGAILLYPVAKSLTDSSEMQLGEVNCAVSLTTRGYLGGVQANAPFYFEDVEVDSIEFVVSVSAVGSYVDWSTLQIQLVLFANDAQLATWNVGTGLNEDAESYAVTKSYMVEELDYLLGSPDEVREDGVEVYTLECKAEATGSIRDKKDNFLSDTLLVRNEWTFLTDPNGVFSLTSPEVTKPSFVTTPENTFAKQGFSKILTWTATDDNPASYEIKAYTPVDGNFIQVSGTWTENTQMQYDVGTFFSIEPGDYTLTVTCTITDQDGHQTLHSVRITMQVTTSTTTTTTFEEEPSQTTTTTDGFGPDPGNPDANSPWGGIGLVSLSGAILGIATLSLIYFWRRE